MSNQAPMSKSEFAAILDVSRETLERLEAYEDLLRRWQARINLVGPRSLDDVWRRHFLDSGQICRLLPERSTLVDIGSGAGFPGLVISILRDAAITLIEADNRKAAFLQEAARITGANVEICAARAESLDAKPVSGVTARALAPLAKLLALAEPWVGSGGQCYFLKGLSVKDELTDANQIWDIRYESVPSLSDPTGTILHVKEFRRV